MAARPHSQGTASVNNKVFRILALLSRLPVYPAKVTARELTDFLEAGGMEVDLRTVERYLEEIERSSVFQGRVICDSTSRPYGWSIALNTNLFTPVMDTSIAITWDLVGRYIRHLLPPSAQSKVNPVIEDAQRWLREHGGKKWSDKVAYIPRGMALNPASVSPAVYQAVLEALFDGRQLEVMYHTHEEPMIIHPRALVDRGPVLYLIGSCWDYDDFRLLALHRIKKASKLGDPVNKLPFSLEDYRATLDLPQGREIKLKLRFYEGAGNHLEETPLNNTQVVKTDKQGNKLVTAHVEDTSELRWWIQAFGSNVEVIAPVALRRHIQKTLSTALKRYSKQG